MNDKKTRDIVITGLMAAIIFVLTYINIRLPFSMNDGGLIHLGGVGLIIACYLLMPVNSALAGGIGMGLFDLLSPYAVWAPFTFFIRFFQGFVFSKLLLKKDVKFEILGLIMFTIIDMAGYYIAEGIIYGNFIAPMASMPAEAILCAASIVIGVPLSKVLNRYSISYK